MSGLVRFLAALLVFSVVACSRDQPVVFAPLPPGAVVLVVGDSLVAGTGASQAQAWPVGLARRTRWEIVNAGVPGDTTAGALERLPDLIADHRPDALIIAIGGNDFLRNVPTDVTRANLEVLIRESRATSRHVALVAIPALSLGRAAVGRLADHEMYAALAREHELALVSSAVSDVLSREEWRSDRIHANAEGYARIAEKVAESLAAQGWVRR